MATADTSSPLPIAILALIIGIGAVSAGIAWFADFRGWPQRLSEQLRTGQRAYLSPADHRRVFGFFALLGGAAFIIFGIVILARG